MMTNARDLLKIISSIIDDGGFKVVTQEARIWSNIIKDELSKPTLSPVAYILNDYNGRRAISFSKKDVEELLSAMGEGVTVKALYEEQPERPLSDDEIADTIDSIDFKSMSTADDVFYLVARAIENAHNIKSENENRKLVRNE